jgi:hypothetical protein
MIIHLKVKILLFFSGTTARQRRCMPQLLHCVLYCCGLQAHVLQNVISCSIISDFLTTGLRLILVKGKVHLDSP